MIKCLFLLLHSVYIVLLALVEHVISAARPDVYLSEFVNTIQHGSGVIKSINSSVCAYLVDSYHTVQTTPAFRPIYLVRGNQSKLIRHQILTIAETVGICLFDPILCAQKQFIQALKLPWPTSHPPLKSPAHPNK